MSAIWSACRPAFVSSMINELTIHGLSAKAQKKKLQRRATMAAEISYFWKEHHTISLKTFCLFLVQKISHSHQIEHVP